MGAQNQCFTSTQTFYQASASWSLRLEHRSRSTDGAMSRKLTLIAVGDGLIPFYPLGNLSQITVKHSEAKEVLPCCYEDQKKLMNAARSYSNSVNDHRRFILFYTALNTGMRYGELAGLKWRDINLEQKCIGVERQCIYAGGDTKPLLSDLKTQSSRRQIFLTDEDASAIRQYRV